MLSTRSNPRPPVNGTAIIESVQPVDNRALLRLRLHTSEEFDLILDEDLTDIESLALEYSHTPPSAIHFVGNPDSYTCNMWHTSSNGLVRSILKPAVGLALANRGVHAVFQFIPAE